MLTRSGVCLQRQHYQLHPVCLAALGGALEKHHESSWFMPNLEQSGKSCFRTNYCIEIPPRNSTTGILLLIVCCNGLNSTGYSAILSSVGKVAKCKVISRCDMTVILV